MSTIKNTAKIGGGAIGGFAAAAALFIAPWEGKANVGYFDIVGVPTYCYGHVGPRDVVGRRYTDAVCQDTLAQDVRSHYDRMIRCAPELSAVSDKQRIAFTSLAFNLGPQIYCTSRPHRDFVGKGARRHRASYAEQGLGWFIATGDMRYACAAISRYNTAGGKPVRGLTNRRAAERKLCELGLVS